MTPLEQAKYLALYWRARAALSDGVPGTIVIKARETAAVLDKLISELERP